MNLNRFLNDAYKNYSLYVLQNRAIPDIFSGLKTSQRKLLFVANRRARNSVKTAALTGYTMAEGHYCHGDGSMNSLLAAMTADYKGGNNYPLFQGEGAFGTHLEPDGVAAARYTAVKLAPVFDKIFPAVDWKIAPKNADPENPEPTCLVPVIPYALVNGIAGIAIGYATKILPYSIEDLCDAVRANLDGRQKRKRLVPFFRDFKGKVYYDELGKVVMEGCFERQGRGKIVVTEVPITESLSSYVKHLNKLRDQGKIKGYVDKSREDWNIEISVEMETMKRLDEELIQLLGLRSKLSENLNFVNFDGKIVHYENAEDYIADFVQIRVGFYEKRKAYVLRELDEEALELSAKISMNEHVKLEKKQVEVDAALAFVLRDLSGAKDPFKKLKGTVLSHKDLEAVANRVIRSISFLGMSDDAAEKNRADLEEKLKARELYHSRTLRDLYEEDLRELEAAVKAINRIKR